VKYFTDREIETRNVEEHLAVRTILRELPDWHSFQACGDAKGSNEAMEIMMVERATETQIVDLLDRILDKGIVIDAWVRIFQAGIDLITVEARVSVASIDTYRKHARPIGLLDLMAWSQPPILKDKASALPSKAKRRSTQVPRGPGERHAILAPPA